MYSTRYFFARPELARRFVLSAEFPEKPLFSHQMGAGGPALAPKPGSFVPFLALIFLLGKKLLTSARQALKDRPQRTVLVNGDASK
jgi:hypothetical protein